MPQLFGLDVTRAALLRHVGAVDQVAGVRLVELADGLARGVRVLEFRTGAGFAFDVLVDRTFDVGRCELRGVPLSWQSAAGVVGPWYYEPEGIGWLRTFGGGMVVTCGLDHTLAGGEDDCAYYNQPHLKPRQTFGLHGRVGGLPARLLGYGERWDGDACTLWAEGEVVQSAVYGEHLVLRRRIEARVGETTFRIRDRVENAGHCSTPHMFLYHCNVGFPVVDVGSRLLVPSVRTTTDYGVAIDGYDVASGPTPNCTEACFEHELVAEPDGSARVAVANERLGMAVYQAFRLDQLPHHTVWRMMGEGTYALGLEPSTNRDAGRWDARRRGELAILEPGEARDYELEIGAVTGPAIAELATRVQQLIGGAADAGGTSSERGDAP